MSHECDQCGMYCDCDGEDMHNPQPENCIHFTPGNCDADLDYADSCIEDEPATAEPKDPPGGPPA